MCPNHRALFDGYHFFIRYIPETSKFVVVNYSNEPTLQPLHGKAIALDAAHRHAPFPTLFIIHEMRVRGHWPLAQTTTPNIPVGSPCQEWILSDGVLASNFSSGIFVRDAPPGNRIVAQPPTMATGYLNNDAINQVLAATRAMQIEGMSWDGTAEENVQKFASSFGVDDSSPI